MDPVTAIITTVGVESLKFFVTAYCEEKRLEGLSAEETVDEFKREYQLFKNSNPDDIPDPIQEAKTE